LKIENFKIAIFFDWLNQWGGAERLLGDILTIFPNANLYTSIWDKSKTPWLPSSTKVFVSKLNNFSFFRQNSPLSLALQPLFLEQFNFKDYQLVISLTSQNGHCLLTPPDTTFVCYHLNPNRYLYQISHSLLKHIYSFYKKIDWIFAQRPDYYFTTSPTVQNRIKQTYGREAEIIHPGVDTDFFCPPKNPKPGNYFLVVSRLVVHKKIELAIRTCHQLKQTLVIAGTGRDETRLKEIIPSSPFIKFVGQVSDKKLLTLYQNCLALICPQEEDFGLTPLEAMACDKPVIAYNQGGIPDTIINHKTGILFAKQTTESLAEAINLFFKTKFEVLDCRRQSLKFSRRRFMLNFTHSLNTILHDQPKIQISG
jgi:glycosyltransferase involved in cell wall biosynthesis